MKLRVAINASPLLAPLTGIGNYIVHLGRALAEGDEVDVHSFYGGSLLHEPPTPRPAEVARRQRSLAFRVLKRVVPFGRELRRMQQRIALSQAFRRDGIVLYHEPNYVPVRYDVPVAVTIHDLSWAHFPQMHPADRVRWLERGLPVAVERAGAILVDSAFVRDEVVGTFGIARDRVHLAHIGVGPEFCPHTPQETAAALQRFDLQHGQYVLTVGTIEPRKNIRHALAAYAMLPPALRARFPLVVAGAKGWHARDLEAQLSVLAARGEVRFLGYVDHRELPALYAGAAVFIFPSVYEGFGLPVLEAMASGVAVLASSRSSIPEVMGSAGVALDPENPEGTAASLAALLEDAPRREHLAREGRERSRAFTWESCARATIVAYRAAMRGIA